MADHSGSTYHFVEAANGLSARPLVVVVELLLEDELELEELLEDEELLDEDDELLLDELELDEDELLLEELLLEDELELEPLIEPAETVRVTLSSLAPSSRLTIRSVCAPAARLLKVAGVMVP